jgi:Uma2 family endonuclease
VLSPTTESIDRREKLHAYQTSSSVKEYLLVSQETMQVELYRRDDKHWQYILLNHHKDILQLSCLDLEMTMPEIYEDVL